MDIVTNGSGAAPSPVADAFCRWCGKPAGSSTCADDACRRPLDPPRCCPTCGRRLRVLVTPSGVRASCRDHGTLAT